MRQQRWTGLSRLLKKRAGGTDFAASACGEGSCGKHELRLRFPALLPMIHSARRGLSVGKASAGEERLASVQAEAAPGAA